MTYEKRIRNTLRCYAIVHLCEGDCLQSTTFSGPGGVFHVIVLYTCVNETVYKARYLPDRVECCASSSLSLGVTGERDRAVTDDWGLSCICNGPTTGAGINGPAEGTDDLTKQVNQYCKDTEDEQQRT